MSVSDRSEHIHRLNRNNTVSYAESLAQVPWQTENKWIKTGYRRRLYTTSQVLWSLVGYWHNESVNAWSHLLGSLLYLVLIPLHLSTHVLSPSFGSRYPILSGILPQRFILAIDEHTHTLVDTLALSIFLCSAVICLGLSGCFHTIMCMSKKKCDAAHRGDYIGIVILIVGSFWPSLYYGFQGQPVYQIFYVTLVSLLGVLAALTVLTPGRNTPAQIWHRTLTFIALGFSAIFPVAHIILVKGLARARAEAGVDWLSAGGLCYVSGAVLYACRFPEKLAPGQFDIIGSSHQLFHCFVLAGSWLHYTGIKEMAGI